MPYTNNDSVRIYYEVEGEGPPLVLIHGFVASLDIWRGLGYVDALKPFYRVILMDARGHGRSDKPHEAEAYSGAAVAGDVTAVLDAEGVSKAHFWGYSRGGTNCFLLAKYAPTRVLSLVSGGIAARSSQGSGGTAKLLGSGMDAVVQALTSDPAYRQFKALVAANDIAALLACSQAPVEPFEDLYSSMQMPCLMYVGDQDAPYVAAQEVVRKLPNATFVGFPGLNHLQCWAESQTVLPPVLAFLEKASHNQAPAPA